MNTTTRVTRLVMLSIPLLAGMVFAIRASLGIASWAYVVYAVVVELLILWTLRPNLQRLARGEERLVGWRAKRKIADDAEAARQAARDNERT